MRRQSVLALAIAVVLGLVAVFLANTYWSSRDAQVDNALTGSVKVAVAAVPLDYGVAVTPDKIRFANYPAKSLPPGVFKTLAEAMPGGKPRIALRPLQQNQLLIASDLTGAGENASIAALLPDGKRAASVRINDVSGVAGFIKPNDTVDVLITRAALGQNREGQVTDVLIQNVRVIATDQKAENKDAAQDFIAFASLPENQAKLPQYVAYGLPNKDAAAKVPAEFAKDLPTDPANMTDAIALNVDFWIDNSETLTQRFNAWLAQ